MFAYCNNSPINSIDIDGEFAISAIIIATLASAATSAIMSAVDQLAFEGEIDFHLVAVSATMGAATTLMTVALGPVGGMIFGSACSAIESLYTDMYNNSKEEEGSDEIVGWGEMVTNAFISAGVSALFSHVGGASNFDKPIASLSKVFKDFGEELFGSVCSWLSTRLTQGATGQVVGW